MVVELQVMVTFRAIPSWSEVAPSSVRPKSPERKSVPIDVKIISMRNWSWNSNHHKEIQLYDKCNTAPGNTNDDDVYISKVQKKGR